MIAIYSNSCIFGGVEMIVERYAKYLNNQGKKFVVIEGKHTKLAKNINWANLVEPTEVANISDDITYLFIPNICKLVNRDFDITIYSNAKICTWVVHPNEAIRSLFPFSGSMFSKFGYKGAKLFRFIIPNHYKLVNNLYKKLNDSKALMVMDEACIRALNYFYPNLNYDNKPTPIPVPVGLLEQKLICSKYIAPYSVGYLGRVDNFKLSALIPFIKNILSHLDSSELHVIGEGPKMEELRDICIKYNVKIVDYGFQKNENARKIIKENTKVAISMGTAALDIAATGHPCIIIDPSLSNRVKPQSKFRFVHEIDGFTLGEYRDFELYKSGFRSFKECIQMINESLNILEYNYVLDNHNPDVIFSEITNLLETSTIHMNEIEDLVYEINESFHKIRYFYKK